MNSNHHKVSRPMSYCQAKLATLWAIFLANYNLVTNYMKNFKKKNRRLRIINYGPFTGAASLAGLGVTIASVVVIKEATLHTETKNKN